MLIFWKVMLVLDVVLGAADLQADRCDLAWWTIFMVVIDLLFIGILLPNRRTQ